jgi:hypothetical protein
MRAFIAYGPGGYCENCHDHDHPVNNIVEYIELPDEPTSE